MEPKEIVAQWVKVFNSGDAKALADFNHGDATNHQVANEPVLGKAAIHRKFRKEFAAAQMHCIVENIFEDGDWAFLDWKDPLGLRGCGFFQSVENKIKFQRGSWDKLSFLKMHKLPIDP